MKLKNIKIADYKSISEIEIPISKRNNSYTTVLLGKNETGKSNILDAMSFLQQYNEEVPVDFLSIRNQQNEADIASVFYTMESENASAYRKHISSALKIPEDILNKISVSSATKESRIQTFCIFTIKPIH